MKNIQRFTRVVLAGLLLAAGVYAQDKPQENKDKDDQNQRDRQEITMTGCLNKDSAGGFQLTDEKNGSKTMVTGAADLEKHASNHRVTLTGMSKTDPSGKAVFEVTKIQHMGNSCKQE
jgi:hypothetical protein